MPNWPEPWLRNIGGKLPSCYAAIDIESSGFGPKDPIVSIAHCQVRDGKIEHRLHVYLDWRKTPWVDLNNLRRGLDKTARELPGYCVTYDMLCRHGQPPEKVFRGYYDIFKALMGRGYYVVGHNSYRFDEPRLTATMRKFNLEFDFADRLIDSQVLEVASRDSDHIAIKYQPDDTLRSWSRRVLNHSSKFTGCRLMEHLVPKYGIVLDYDRAHDADVGAMAVYYLTEHLRGVVDFRDDPLHPSQWDIEKPRSQSASAVPDSGLPLKPMNQPRQITGGLKRFRGQRSS